MPRPGPQPRRTSPSWPGRGRPPGTAAAGRCAGAPGTPPGPARPSAPAGSAGRPWPHPGWSAGPGGARTRRAGWGSSAPGRHGRTRPCPASRSRSRPPVARRPGRRRNPAPGTGTARRTGRASGRRCGTCPGRPRRRRRSGRRRRRPRRDPPRGTAGSRLLAVPLSDYSQRMEQGMIEAVRRFNRAVTQRAGALDDAFLARGRPLGQARVLWEIGPDGRDVRDLRVRLDLDSGYLSRLLRALERDGMVTVEANEADGRIRTARLTVAGRAERAEFDRLSDDAAVSLLGPLSERQRGRLVAAMAEVERVLGASGLMPGGRDPRDPDAWRCLRAYVDELAGRFDDGFDPARSISAADHEMTPPAGLFLVATLHGEPAGGGARRFPPGAPAEVKRMWVAPAVRGLGLGRRLLAELEAQAAAHGVRALRLENTPTLTEAV